MKRTIWILALLVLTGMTVASCSLRYGSIGPGNQTEVKGSGVVVSEERPVSGFDKILLEGTAKMEIRLGDSESLRLEGEDNILPLITSEVKGNRLVIGVKPGYNLNMTEPVRVWITMKALQGVQIDGAGSAEALALEGEQLDLVMNGAGLINVAGSVERLGVKVSGAGSIDAGDLQAKTASVDVDGLGFVVVWATDSLKVTLDGAGSVSYYGEPPDVSKEVNGAGTVVSKGTK